MARGAAQARKELFASLRHGLILFATREPRRVIADQAAVEGFQRPRRRRLRRTNGQDEERRQVVPQQAVAGPSQRGGQPSRLSRRIADYPRDSPFVTNPSLVPRLTATVKLNE